MRREKHVVSTVMSNSKLVVELRSSTLNKTFFRGLVRQARSERRSLFRFI